MVTKTIGTTSRDFSTVAAWIVYLEALTFTEDEFGDMYNDSIFATTASIDFIAANINQGTDNVTLRAAAGESFNDHANKLTNALWANQSNGVLIEKTSGSGALIQSDLLHFDVEGLQLVKDSLYGSVYRSVSNATTGDKVVDSCIIVANAVGGNGNACVARQQDYVNSLIAQNSGGGEACITSDYGTISNVDACTLVRTKSASTTTGLNEIGSGSIDIRNSAIFGFNTLASGNVTGDYNASDLAIGFGSNNQASKTYADQFEDITNNNDWTATSADFRAKSTGDLNGNGNSVTLPALDILEQTRAADYIGAHEVAAGAPTGNPRTLPLMGVG